MTQLNGTLVSLDIIVLTKDNPDELAYTLSSIPLAPSWLQLRVLIIDGSSADSIVEELADLLVKKRISFSHVSSSRSLASGIYPSMNLALSQVNSDWFIFLNSGDAFSPSFCFSRIHQFLKSSSIAVFFGQALIVSLDSSVAWLVPDSRVGKINNWLRFFEPNHQAMFLRRCVATKYFFDVSSPIGADAAWKRQILALEPYVYTQVCIADFRLGGVSSSYTFARMLVKLREPSRRAPEKAMEVLKFFLHKLGVMSPSLQKMKSHLLGLLF
jgi:hypothetical protein